MPWLFTGLYLHLLLKGVIHNLLSKNLKRGIISIIISKKKNLKVKKIMKID